MSRRGSLWGSWGRHSGWTGGRLYIVECGRSEVSEVRGKFGWTVVLSSLMPVSNLDFANVLRHFIYIAKLFV